MRASIRMAHGVPALATCLIFLSVSPLFPAVKQVRVKVERASIHIEPDRSSTRIEIVPKGTVLNLLQERKVRDIWYYVSFTSPRYGRRISGFVQDWSVEPAVEAASAGLEAKKEEAPRPKPEVKKEAPREAPAEKVAPKAKPAVEAPPGILEVSVATPLPRGRTYPFPRREPQLQELAWTMTKVAPSREEKPPETPEKVPEAKPVRQPAKPQPVRVPQVTPSKKGPGLITLSVGYGSSYGGAGGCLQLNTWGGLCLHAGVGLYPTTLVYSETDWVKNETMWSAGLKYYLPVSSSLFSPFVDIQYGGLRVEAAQVVIGIWEYDYVLSREQKSLWGPSFLAGVEIGKGRFGLTAALGVSYVTSSWKYLEDKASPVFDVGLVLHF